MYQQRMAHYWQWFLLFGGVSAAVAIVRTQTLDLEAAWLFLAGLLGLLAGIRALAPHVARPYDLLAGLFFAAVGALGILHQLGAEAASFIPAGQGALAGLSLALPYALIHASLGVSSLAHGLRRHPAQTPAKVVARVGAEA